MIFHYRNSKYLNDASPGKAQSLLPNILGEDDTAGPHK